MNITDFSKQYKVRLLDEKDIDAIYSLCSQNELYYKYCPPFVTKENIKQDMQALPPHKELKDKYYIGYFEDDRLVAVMDFIKEYPNNKTAFIGFFMVDISKQKRGLGTSIIEELCDYLRNEDFSYIRLGWVLNNEQASHFWKKNKFVETGITYKTTDYTVVVAQRELHF